MAMLPSVFNTSENKGPSFEPFPAGVYEMEINKSSIKTSKAGDNYLSLGMKVCDGEYKDRMVWVNLNLWHKNPKAAEIAQREFAAICEACGLESVEDSNELHGIPIGVLVNIEEGQNGWPPANRAKKFYALSDMPEEGSPF